MHTIVIPVTTITIIINMIVITVTIRVLKLINFHIDKVQGFDSGTIIRFHSAFA